MHLPRGLIKWQTMGLFYLASSVLYLKQKGKSRVFWGSASFAVISRILQDCEQQEGNLHAVIPDRKTCNRVIEKAQAGGSVQVGDFVHAKA